MSSITQRPENQAVREIQGRRQIEKTLQIPYTWDDDQVEFKYVIQNPSRRLSLSIEVFYAQLDASTDPAVVIAWINGAGNGTIDTPLAADTNTITLRGRTSNVPVLGNAADLISIPGSGSLNWIVETPAQLPFAYELDTALRQIDATIVLQGPTVDEIATPITWYIRTRWEPNIEISDRELVDLFAACDLKFITMGNT